jgi:hypothetical protein
LEEVGFEAVAITERFDPFAGSSKENTARRFGVEGVNVTARRKS